MPAVEKPPRSSLVPRPWQEEALRAWRASHRRGVASVVTGAGKTAFALIAYADAHREVPELRLVVLVPTIALLDQWAVALETDGGLDQGSIATYSGEGRAAEPRQANVIVLNTARTIVDTFRDGRPTMLVVDECHRAGSPENARALAIPSVSSLGLSATPVREFDDGFQRYVEPALGSVIFEYDYASARRDGVISPFTLHNFRFDLSPREASEYDRLTRKIAVRMRATDGEADLVVKRLALERASLSATSPRRNAATVAVAEKYPRPMLVFHERIANAERIAGLLDRRGHRVAIYHSGIGGAIRRRNLEMFKLGEIDVLVTCRALDEGLNVPNANAAVIGASTRSTRQRIQRLGRVLRVAQNKQQADVATVFATDHERQMLESEAEALTDVADTHWYRIDL